MQPRPFAAVLALLALVALPARAREAAPARPELPAEGTCPAGLAAGATVTISEESFATLAPHLPPEVAEQREAFFFDGMQLEIGPCQRRYPPPEPWTEATRAGHATLDARDDLLDYGAGWPFPPGSIDPADPQAGARWAWDFAWRYRGAGPHGELVIHELAPGKERSQEYSGKWFLQLTRHRADLAATGYVAEAAPQYLWVAGGRFRRPGRAANLAWRQFRVPEAMQDYRRADDIFVYVPNLRRVRRSATAWVDGLFVPRYTASELSERPVLERESRRLGRPQSVQGAAASENIRHGLVGLVYRPNAYTWTVSGTRDVVAPLNVADRPGASFDWAGYQKIDLAKYGPRGVAFDGERWDVRRALVLEGVPREPAGLVRRLTLYLDLETLHPLYVIERSSKARPIQVGVLLHSWSGDAEEPYGDIAPGVPANVFDPVAEAFLATGPGGSTWRRESWGVSSLPVPDDELRLMASTARLKQLP